MTESENANEEEYGEIRQLRVLQNNRTRPPCELLNAVIADVQQFSVREQADDLTLVIARVL